MKRKEAEGALKDAHEETRRENDELAITLKELQSAQVQLVQSEKMTALGKITADIAHEVNNPIGATRSAADVMARCVEEIEHKVSSISDLDAMRETQATITLFVS